MNVRIFVDIILCIIHVFLKRTNFNIFVEISVSMMREKVISSMMAVVKGPEINLKMIAGE